MDLFQWSFYAAIFFTIIGGIMGLLGVWFADFWKNDIAWKLILTDIILAVTSIIVATITKFLH
jgi:hypothetical protein